MPRHLLVLASLLLLAAAAFAMACSTKHKGGNVTATSTLDSTAVATVPSETSTPAPDIRQKDLTQQPGLQAYLSTSGGQVVDDSVVYADVTGDQVEEAILPISSGGEGGNIALFVYGYQPSGLEELLRVTTQTRLTAGVVDGVLRVTEASFAPGDPLCCPSDLKTTTYQWDGTRLVPEGQGQ